LWSIPDGKTLWPEPLKHKGSVWTAEFSPNGKYVVTASEDRSAVVWDAVSAQPITRALRHDRGVAMASFSPDSKWVVTCSADGTSRVWESMTGNAVSAVMRHSDRVRFARFSPDGSLVLTACDDGTARLWEARSGYPVSEPLKHRGKVTWVQFSPDGKQCLSIANSDVLQVWDVPQAPSPVPSWFCDLVEGVAGRRLDARGDWEPASAQGLEAIKKSQLANETAFYANWARQFLVERLEGGRSH
jgi:WD40 repeat protein